MALLSAVLHAGWNAAVKASPAPKQVMTAQMIGSAMLVLPGLMWTGLPAAASWPWLAASTLMNACTVTALLRAYALGGFGVVYAFVRATSVMLVVPLAAMTTGEWPGPATLAGIVSIGAALVTLSMGAGDQAGGGLPRAALGWTLAAGATTAIYIICDAQGARQSGSAWAYCFAVSAANAVVMSWLHRSAGPPWRTFAAHWQLALPVAVASTLSYLMILWVWTSAPIAPAAAVRDSSAIFGILIAVVWLKEPFDRSRLLAVALAAAGLPLLRLG